MAALDYSDPGNWFLLPGAERRRDVPDVFAIAPTVVFDEAGPVYVEPQDPAFTRGLGEFVEECVAPVFGGLAANVWAPRYRQVNGAKLGAKGPNAFLLFSDPDDGGWQPPLEDCAAAFEFFLANRNPDQWWLLWTHSQGSIINTYLTTEFAPSRLSEAEVARLGINGLFGWGLTDATLAASPWPASESPDDTGVIVSYNTATASEVKSMWRVTWGDATTHAVNPLTFDLTPETVQLRGPSGVLRFQEGGPLEPVSVSARLVRPTDEGGQFPGLVVLAGIDEHDFRDAAAIAAQDAAGLGYAHHWDISLYAEALKANLISRLGVGPA